MKFYEERRDLFTLGSEYKLVHCIAQDIKMGAGIAVPIAKKYKLHKLLKDKVTKYPDCIYENGVFNLITKEHSSGKPDYVTLRASLSKMRDIIKDEKITHIGMPKIGCGLDKLDWRLVEGIIKDIFNKMDIEIRVCIWG